jgi:hypothetical protein
MEHTKPDGQATPKARTAPSPSSKSSSSSAQRLAKAKEFCSRYPDCCFRDLTWYRLLLKEQWSPKQLEVLEAELFEKLNSRVCPDPRMKSYAISKINDLWHEARDAE